MKYLFRADSSLQVSLQSNVGSGYARIDEELPSTTILSNSRMQSNNSSLTCEDVEDSHDNAATASSFKESCNNSNFSLDLTNVDEELHDDSIEYLAGFIAFKLTLGTDYYCQSDSTYTFVDEISEGGLVKPNEIIVQKLKILDDIFKSVNKDSLETKIELINTLLKKSENVELEDGVKKLFFKCRIFFRTRQLNHKITKFSTQIRKHKKTFT